MRGLVLVLSRPYLHAMTVAEVGQYDRFHHHQNARDVSLLQRSVTEEAESVAG